MENLTQDVTWRNIGILHDAIHRDPLGRWRYESEVLLMWRSYLMGYEPVPASHYILAPYTLPTIHEDSVATIPEADPLARHNNFLDLGDLINSTRVPVPIQTIGVGEFYTNFHRNRMLVPTASLLKRKKKFYRHWVNSLLTQATPIKPDPAKLAEIEEVVEDTPTTSTTTIKKF